MAGALQKMVSRRWSDRSQKRNSERLVSTTQIDDDDDNDHKYNTTIIVDDSVDRLKRKRELDAEFERNFGSFSTGSIGPLETDYTKRSTIMMIKKLSLPKLFDHHYSSSTTVGGMSQLREDGDNPKPSIERNTVLSIKKKMSIVDDKIYKAKQRHSTEIQRRLLVDEINDDN